MRCVPSDHGSEIGHFGRFWALRTYNYWTDALKMELAHCQMRVEESVAFLTWVIWAVGLQSQKQYLGSSGLAYAFTAASLCATHINKVHVMQDGKLQSARHYSQY